MKRFKNVRIYLYVAILFIIATIILVLGLLFLKKKVFLIVNGNYSHLIGIILVSVGISVYLIVFILAKKQILRYKTHTLQFLFVCILIFLEVNIFHDFIPLPTAFLTIDSNIASSTLDSMLGLLGPLLGVIGALLIFFYKSLEDRKMFWEKELIECMEKPYRKKAIIDELKRRINKLTAEAGEIKLNLVFVFHICLNSYNMFYKSKLCSNTVSWFID